MSGYVRLFVCALSVRSCVAPVRPAEKQALWALYLATGGPQWKNNTNWNLDTDPCRRKSSAVPYRTNDGSPTYYKTGAVFNATPWYGVFCSDPCDDYLDGPNCTGGRITALSLRDNGLVGSLAAWTSVGAMANLTQLDLAYNSLSGSLPTQVGRIRNLERLSLRNNALSGPLPPHVARVNARGAGRLLELDLSYNLLEGFLPSELDRHAGSLELLDVQSNKLSGTLPPAIGQLPFLQVLALQRNSFSGTLPADFAGGGVWRAPTPADEEERAASLRATAPPGFGELYETEGGDPARRGGLQLLRYLSLQSNAALSGTLPSSIGLAGHDGAFPLVEGHERLLELHLYGTRLSGTLPTELGRLTGLHTLRLSSNSISGSIPTQAGLLTRLEELDLYDNPLEGDMPAELAALINLRLLYLPNEQLRPLRMHYCGQRMPNVGKYSYRIVREEYHKFSSAICENPLSTLQAFGSLDDQIGDVG